MPSDTPMTEAGRRLLGQTLDKRITAESIIAIEAEARADAEARVRRLRPYIGRDWPRVDHLRGCRGSGDCTCGLDALLDGWQAGSPSAPRDTAAPAGLDVWPEGVECDCGDMFMSPEECVEHARDGHHRAARLSAAEQSGEGGE